MKKKIVSLLLAVSLCFSLVPAAFAANNPFSDVSETDYFYDAVMWAVENGVTSGTSATTFSPGTTCTRGQVVTFLWRAAGSPAPKATVNPFSDVTPSNYFFNPVLWAVEQGITSGTSATTFSPNETCTHAQVITFLWRSKGSPDASGASKVAEACGDTYYTKAVAWADTSKVLSGTTTVFSPNNACPRSDIVSYMYQVFKGESDTFNLVVQTTNTSITLSWNAYKGAEFYTVLLKTPQDEELGQINLIMSLDGEPLSTDISYTPDVAPYLFAGNTVYYQIVAWNGDVVTGGSQIAFTEITPVIVPAGFHQSENTDGNNSGGVTISCGNGLPITVTGYDRSDIRLVSAEIYKVAYEDGHLTIDYEMLFKRGIDKHYTAADIKIYKNGSEVAWGTFAPSKEVGERGKNTPLLWTSVGGMRRFSFENGDYTVKFFDYYL